MKMSGGGFGSSVDLTAGADVVDAGDGTTTLKWKGVAEVRGPVAAVGGRVLEAQATKADRADVREHPRQALDMTTADERLLPEDGRVDAGSPIVRRRDRRRPARACVRASRATARSSMRTAGWTGSSAARAHGRSSGSRRSELIRTRQFRLVSIRPDATGPSAADPEHVVVPMSCVSEGAVDVYIEPFVHARRLVVVGATPVADILARTSVTLDYDVVRVVDASEQRDIPSVSGLQVVPLESLADELRGQDGIAAVVASQGHYDEDALQVILGAGVAYIGLVASRKRWTTMRAALADTGVDGLDQVHNPAGLDLGGRTPGEVAVSIWRSSSRSSR